MTLRTFAFILQSLAASPAGAVPSPSPSWYLGPHADDATAEAYGDLRLPTGAVDGLVYLHSGTSKMRARIGGVWVVYDLDAQAAATAAAASAAAALVSEGLAEADKVQTGLDRVQTGLDRVQTGADVVTTAAARDAALAALDSFDDRYLGAKASDPTLDNDGNALITGALYWNTPLAKMRTWSGAIWTDSIPGSYLATTGGTMTGQLLGAVGTAGAPGFSFAADAGTGMWRPSAGVIGWSTSGTEKMRLTSAGDVGIGTATPLTKLDLRSGVITAGSTISTGGSEILRGYYTNGALAVLGTDWGSGAMTVGYGVKPSTSTSDSFLSSTGLGLQRSAYSVGITHKWFTGASQTIAEGSAVTMSERMRLSAAGGLSIGTTTDAGAGNLLVNSRIGIGTASAPAYPLDISGTSPSIRVSGTSNTTPQIILSRVGNALAGVRVNAAGKLAFYNDAGNEALVIGASAPAGAIQVLATGNVGFGVSSFGTSAANVLGIANGTAPTTSPAGMGQLYVVAGELWYRGSSGTTTKLAVA